MLVWSSVLPTGPFPHLHIFCLFANGHLGCCWSMVNNAAVSISIRLQMPFKHTDAFAYAFLLQIRAYSIRGHGSTCPCAHRHNQTISHLWPCFWATWQRFHLLFSLASIVVIVPFMNVIFYVKSVQYLVSDSIIFSYFSMYFLCLFVNYFIIQKQTKK